jgi:hypothetical protein
MTKREEDFHLAPENTSFNEFMNNIILLQKEDSSTVASVMKSSLYYPDFRLTLSNNKTLIISEN